MFVTSQWSSGGNADGPVHEMVEKALWKRESGMLTTNITLVLSKLLNTILLFKTPN